jgi:hypothetical protein
MQRRKKMRLDFLPDGTNRETFETEGEYQRRLTELQREMGKRGIVYHGWLNRNLVIIYR